MTHGLAYALERAPLADEPRRRLLAYVVVNRALFRAVTVYVAAHLPPDEQHLTARFRAWSHFRTFTRGVPNA